VKQLSKIIAVWGSPNSGKTNFAVKLALSIAENKIASVLVLFCDSQTPTLPIVFPNKKADEIFSVGVPLSKTEILQSEILKNIVTIKSKSNIGFLGYKDGENQYSYPKYDKAKATDLLTVLKSMVDYVIVDCTSSFKDLLSITALEMADNVFQFATPDMKSICFFSSQLPLYADQKYKFDEHIVILNILDKELYTPIEDVKTHFKNVEFMLPFCSEIRRQEMNGELIKDLSDKKYASVLKAVKDRVI